MHDPIRSIQIDLCVILSHQMELDDMLWQNTQDLCRPEALCALGRYPLLGTFANSTTKCPTAELKQAPHNVRIILYNSIHIDTILYILTVLLYVITWSCMIYIYTYIYIYYIYIYIIIYIIYIHCRIMMNYVYTRYQAWEHLWQLRKHQPDGLEVDDGTFELENLMEAWGHRQGREPFLRFTTCRFTGEVDLVDTDNHCGPLWTCVLPSGYVKIAIENGPVEIVDNSPWKK